MYLAWKAHRATPLMVALTLLSLASLVVGDLMLALPSISGIEGVPARLVLALIGCVLVGRSITDPWPTNRLTPVRRPGALTGGVGLLAVLWPLALGAVARAFDRPEPLAFAAVLAWLLALQLVIASTWSATYQAMGPAAYVFLCALLGRSAGVAQMWAWPLFPTVSDQAVGVSVLVFGLAIGLVVVRGLRIP